MAKPEVNTRIPAPGFGKRLKAGENFRLQRSLSAGSEAREGTQPLAAGLPEARWTPGATLSSLKKSSQPAFFCYH
jgi:hypothetical protein